MRFEYLNWLGDSNGNILSKINIIKVVWFVYKHGED